MTFAEAKVIVNSNNCTITKKDNEYRVNLKGGNEGSAYYTDDLQDAVDTSKAMKRRTI